MTPDQWFEMFGSGSSITNFDDWPNPSSTTAYLKAVRMIVDAGFAGVMIESVGTVEGVHIDIVLTNFATPEGRLVVALELGASAGYAIPPESAIATLQRVYSELGIPLTAIRGGHYEH